MVTPLILNEANRCNSTYHVVLLCLSLRRAAWHAEISQLFDYKNSRISRISNFWIGTWRKSPCACVHAALLDHNTSSLTSKGGSLCCSFLLHLFVVRLSSPSLYCIFYWKMSVRSAPLICSGHSRPVPDLAYSPNPDDGYFIVSACLGMNPLCLFIIQVACFSFVS